MLITLAFKAPSSVKGGAYTHFCRWTRPSPFFPSITLEDLLKEVSVHPEKLNESISDDHLCEIALFLPSWCKVSPYFELGKDDVGKDELTRTL